MPEQSPFTLSFVPPPTDAVDVMVDLETLSTRPDAAIISIGACWFEPVTGLVGSPIHILIDLADSIRSGGHVDGDIVHWWLQQSYQARQAITEGCKSTMDDALYALSEYLRSVAPLDKVLVWGNGADFDLSILASAYARADIYLPWRYYNGRCLRTLRKLHPDVDAPKFEGTPHNAADDARHQAQHAVALLRVNRLQKVADSALQLNMRAVHKVIDRMVADGRLAWLIGPGSETFNQLISAAACGSNKTPEQIADEITAAVRPQRVVVDESEG